MASDATSDNTHGDARPSFRDEDMFQGGNEREFREHFPEGERDNWEIYVPKEKNCDVWHSSPNKERHASFGDEGTTASTSCYGGLIQMSRFLGAGRSGVFTIDQCSIPEPYFVTDRAQDLLSRSTDPGGDGFSFGLEVPWSLFPRQDEPLEVKWVHRRWPRYEYDTRLPGVKACFQYMVHGGIVLQQFTVENTNQEDVTTGNFGFKSELLIRDLDFLDGKYEFNERRSDSIGLSVSLGPSGYDHVTTSTLEPTNSSTTSSSRGSALHLSFGDQQEPSSQPQAVASVITIFINGKATKTRSDDSLASLPNVLPGKPTRTRSDGRRASFTDLPPQKATETQSDGRPPILPDELHGKGDGTDSNKLQIVVAYKLLLIPKSEVDRTDFVISARAANINHWLRKERDEFVKGGDKTSLRTMGLSMINIRESDMGKPGPDDLVNAESGKQDTAGSSTDLPDPKVPFDIPRTSSPKYHLEYLAWRHLEHILSVCAVPLSTSGLIGQKVSPLPPNCSGLGTQDKPVIALTCGDMSGHRINTSASYFAFLFLIDVARRLKNCWNKTPYIEELEKRIEKTCRGHIRWLQWLRKSNQPKDSVDQEFIDNKKLMKRAQFLQTGCFAANYWVTGEAMLEDSITWQPPDAMTDTALQILKLQEFLKLYSDVKPEDVAHQVTDDIYIPWLVELDRLDRWKAFAWPHTLEEGISTFRLDDHFWIWKALKFLDDTATIPRENSRQRRLRNHQPGNVQEKELKSKHPWLMRLYKEEISEAFKKFTDVAQRLSQSDVRRGILQRFTLENDVSRRRMLAVTRSARETRFLFHARDTALFYGEDCGFFPKESSFKRLWVNTINTQRHHEENQQNNWKNPLRYGLGILMGTRGHTLNEAEASDLVTECVTALIGSSGHDAFFPGELEGGREPMIFRGEEYRDFFYHVGFEVNHILLSNARKIHESFLPTQADTSRPTIAPSGSSEPAKQPIAPKEAADQPSNPLLMNLLLEKMGIDPHVFNNLRNLKMKKLLPFTNVIYGSNINAIEEEWIYNYPDFFSDSVVDDKCIISLLKSEDFLSESVGKVIGDTISSLRSSKEGLKIEKLDWSSSELNRLGSKWEKYSVSIVADRKKQKRLGRRRQRQSEMECWKPPNDLTSITSNKSLFEYLGASRTADKAKKRLIWLPCADSLTAFACWAASPDRERHAMSLFFDRHAKYENNAWDETSIVFNVWQSELHLSFYVLVDEDALSSAGIPGQASEKFPGRTNKLLRRASISFRFDGDFFDRHWTCHLIQHVPSIRNEAEQISPFKSSTEDASNLKRINTGQLRQTWWQRKVLEMYLLNQALERIDQESRSLLEEVRAGLLDDQRSLACTSLDNQRGSVSMRDLKRFEQDLRDAVSMQELKQFDKILQSMEEDLTSNLTTVQKWTSREKNRGGENPRWTQNDERKYRTAIRKANNATEQTVGVLESRLHNIQTLKDDFQRLKDDFHRQIDDLASRQTEIRDAQEFHQNENVRYFTYATVIFLPLGFAASFFSMSGVPDHAIVVSLVQFAVAALAVTIAILLSVRLALKSAETTLRPLLSKLTSFESVMDLFLRLSAGRVLSATLALKKDKQTARSILDVLLGVLFTPIFGALWLAKALILNIFDLLPIYEHVTQSWKLPESFSEQTETQARLKRLMIVPHILLPFVLWFWVLK